MGFSDAEEVKRDFDNLSFKVVKHWALKTLRQFRPGSFLILKSIETSYYSARFFLSLNTIAPITTRAITTPIAINAISWSSRGLGSGV
jgi:hypothetical protein